MQENIQPSISENIPQVVSEQPKQSNFLTILLSVLLIISVLISSFFAYQTQRLVADLKVKNEELITKTSEPAIESAATNNTIPTLGPTANWKTYNGKGFQIMYPTTWPELKNNCQSISITKSDSIDLELNIREYVRREMNLSDNTNLDQIINEVDKKFKFKFNNILDSNVVILGPQGINEVNNVFIRGPEGTGYYKILINYIGPVPDINNECLGDKDIEYKEILSTFRFLN